MPLPERYINEDEHFSIDYTGWEIKPLIQNGTITLNTIWEKNYEKCTVIWYNNYTNEQIAVKKVPINEDIPYVELPERYIDNEQHFGVDYTGWETKPLVAGETVTLNTIWEKFYYDKDYVSINSYVYIDGAESAGWETDVYPSKDTWMEVYVHRIKGKGGTNVGCVGLSDGYDWRMFVYYTDVCFDCDSRRLRGSISSSINTDNLLYIKCANIDYYKL